MEALRITTEEILAELRKQREAVSKTGVTLAEAADAMGISQSQMMVRMNGWMKAGEWRKVRVMRPTRGGVMKPVPGYEPVKPPKKAK